jgi:acyl carrier protein
LSNSTRLPNHKPSADTELEIELKHLIINTFDLEDLTVDDIDSSAALFEGGIGLDSIDALELGFALKNTFGIIIDPDLDEVNQYFASISALAIIIEQWQNQQSRLT